MPANTDVWKNQLPNTSIHKPKISKETKRIEHTYVVHGSSSFLGGGSPNDQWLDPFPGSRIRLCRLLCPAYPYSWKMWFCRRRDCSVNLAPTLFLKKKMEWVESDESFSISLKSFVILYLELCYSYYMFFYYYYYKK